MKKISIITLTLLIVTNFWSLSANKLARFSFGSSNKNKNAETRPGMRERSQTFTFGQASRGELSAQKNISQKSKEARMSWSSGALSSSFMEPKKSNFLQSIKGDVEKSSSDSFQKIAGDDSSRDIEAKIQRVDNEINKQKNLNKLRLLQEEKASLQDQLRELTDKEATLRTLSSLAAEKKSNTEEESNNIGFKPMEDSSEQNNEEAEKSSKESFEKDSDGGLTKNSSYSLKDFNRTMRDKKSFNDFLRKVFLR